jgi:hypothetical protein
VILTDPGGPLLPADLDEVGDEPVVVAIFTDPERPVVRVAASSVSLSVVC